MFHFCQLLRLRIALVRHAALARTKARLSGVPEADVPGLVKGNTYLTPAQQVQQLTGPVNKAIVDTATFLQEQGKVPAVAADSSQYVTDRFVK